MSETERYSLAVLRGALKAIPVVGGVLEEVVRVYDEGRRAPFSAGSATLARIERVTEGRGDSLTSEAIERRAEATLARRPDWLRQTLARNAERVVERAERSGEGDDAIAALSVALIRWATPDEIGNATGRPPLMGRFQLVRQIGSGGFSVVWLAQDLKEAGTEVAVKLLRPKLDSDEAARERFEREVALMESLPHERLVGLREKCLGQRPPFFVMDLVRGCNLRDLMLLEGGTLRAGVVARIGWQVAEVLVFLRQRGVLHRDLKPENIMLTPKDGSFEVRVLDLGIGREVSTAARPEGATARTGVVGTVPYMSPERIRGASCGSESDVYALAVVMFECLAGVPPFSPATNAEDPDASLRATILEANPGTLPRTLPHDLAALINSGLDKEPARRPTPEELVEVLRRFEGQAADLAPTTKLIDCAINTLTGLPTPHPPRRFPLRKMLLWLALVVALIIAVAAMTSPPPPPWQLRLTSPLLVAGADAYLSSSISMRVAGRLLEVPEGTDAHISVSGLPLPLDQGKAFATDLQLEEGVHNLLVVASVGTRGANGVQGDLRQEIVRVLIDRTPPRVELKEHADSKFLPAGMALLQIETSDAGPVEVQLQVGDEWEARSVRLGPGEPACIELHLPPGTTRVIARGVDAVGLEGRSMPLDVTMATVEEVVVGWSTGPNILPSGVERNATAHVYTHVQTGLELVWVPPSNKDQGYFIGRTEVPWKTLAADVAVQATASKRQQALGDGEEHPVRDFSWQEATDWCRSKGLRLPTGEEWKRAAKDGVKEGNLRGPGPRPVSAAQGDKAVDMIGNVWEWVSDQDKDMHFVRGGSWQTELSSNDASPDGKSNDLGGVAAANKGFRVALSATHGTHDAAIAWAAAQSRPLKPTGTDVGATLELPPGRWVLLGQAFLHHLQGHSAFVSAEVGLEVSGLPVVESRTRLESVATREALALPLGVVDLPEANSTREVVLRHSFVDRGAQGNGLVWSSLVALRIVHGSPPDSVQSVRATESLALRVAGVPSPVRGQPLEVVLGAGTWLLVGHWQVAGDALGSLQEFGVQLRVGDAAARTLLSEGRAAGFDGGALVLQTRVLQSLSEKTVVRVVSTYRSSAPTSVEVDERLFALRLDGALAADPRAFRSGDVDHGYHCKASLANGAWLLLGEAAFECHAGADGASITVCLPTPGEDPRKFANASGSEAADYEKQKGHAMRRMLAGPVVEVARKDGLEVGLLTAHRSPVNEQTKTVDHRLLIAPLGPRAR